VIGDILGDTWSMYAKHFTHFVPIAAVFFLILSAIALALALLLGWIGAVASFLVTFIGIFWLQGTLVEAIADVRDGRADMSIGETYARARPYIFTMFGAGILAVIGIVIGLILLIVPGLILLTWWSLIIPVIVLEKVGVMDSFGRSRELVRGNGWNVFGVIVITGILIGIASNIVRVIFVWLPGGLDYYVGNVVANSLLAPVAAIAWTLMYYRLARKDVGVGESAPSTDAATS
jgi:hypothetical protein